MKAAHLHTRLLGSAMSFQESGRPSVTTEVTGVYITGGGEVIITDDRGEWTLTLFDDVDVAQSAPPYTRDHTQITADMLTAQYIGRDITFTDTSGRRITAELRQLDLTPNELLLWTCPPGHHSGTVDDAIVHPAAAITVAAGRGLVDDLNG